jgi:hypothetical protein
MIEQPLNQQFAQQNRQLLNYLSRWDLRLRLSQLALWVPRGILTGLTISIVVAAIAWVRPLIAPSQLAVFAAGLVGIGIAIATMVVMVWPRSTLQKAQYFDSVFGLKERSSTALELSSGKIRAPQSILSRQLQDTIQRAGQIRAADHLRPQFRRVELILIVVMLGILTLLLLLYNPQNAILDQQQAVNSAINQQVQKLEQIQQDIQKNANLTEQEKKDLNKIIQDTIDQLKQPNITQPEAVAALSNAQQKLNQAGQQLSTEQQQAMQNAGSDLGASQATQGIGQKLQNGDLAGAANELKNLGQKTGDNQLTDQQKNDAANALEKAADDLAGMNPAAADALRRAADALRKGDNAAAQKAMQEASDALQDQQDKMNQSAQSQAAKAAADAAQQGQQDVAKAGQENQKGGQAGQNSQNQMNPPSDAQMSNQSGNQQNQPNTGQQGQQSNQQGNQSSDTQGGQQGDQQGQQGGQQNQQSGSQPGEGQQGQAGDGQNTQAGNQQGGISPDNGQTGDGQAGNDKQGGGQQGGNQSGAGESENSGQQSGSQSGQSSGQGAGQGEGGAGNDVTSGDANAGGNTPNTNNGNGDGQVKPYEGVYAPSFVGGSGGNKLQPDGTSPTNGKDPLQQGEFSNNPTGESVVPLNSVVDQAAAQADRAMDLNKVPGSLRGVIRNYFTGLQEQ